MTAKLSHARALYMDTESACWDGPPPEGYANDIIEIGIVDGDLQNLTANRQCTYLVRPEKFQISEFCTSLTGITEKAVHQHGRPFAERIATITNALGPGSKLCFTWGDERRPIAAACEKSGIANPFNFIDLGWLYRCYFGIKRNVGLENALKSLGLEFEGTPHRASIDAYNTARLHFALIERFRSAGPLILPE